MTPLAQHFAKQLTLPLVRRDPWWRPGVLQEALSDVHCFEATEVLPLIGVIGEMTRSNTEEQNDSIYENGAFLPAPRTWIEFMPGNLQRIALLVEQKDEECASVTAFWKVCAWEIGLIGIGSPNNRVYPHKVHVPNDWMAAYGNDMGWGILGLVHTILVIINSPRLIGRKQHMPHRGLERKLANAKGLVGKFPLRAWTELKLSVSDIGRRADGTTHEAHYTGEKCLHFCRSHLRIRNGRLERVSAHWRGNPALGIKRTRYKLTA